MYSEITLEQLFALITELAGLPDAQVELSVRTGGLARRGGGGVFYSHSRCRPIRKEEGIYYSRPNPNLDARYQSQDFQEICRKHGIEAEFDCGAE